MKTIRVTANELERSKLVRGDVLFVEGHGNPAEIGRCAVWDGSITPCVHQNHLIRLRLGTSAVPEYISAFLNSDGGRRQLLRFGKTTSGLNTISTSNVKSSEVLLPPLELQKGFADLVFATRRQEVAVHANENALTELFRSLEQRAFRGEL